MRYVIDIDGGVKEGEEEEEVGGWWWTKQQVFCFGPRPVLPLVK